MNNQSKIQNPKSKIENSFWRYEMNKQRVFLLISLIAMLVLVACGGSAESDVGAESVESGGSVDQVSEPAAEEQSQEPEKVRLAADYSDALTVESQLALGSLQLEESALAVDEAQAAELLPLWQAFQSLSNSDIAAAAEVTALINQIQDTMAPEQVQAIADMALTEDRVTEMIESGELQLRGFGGRGGFGGDGGGEDGGFSGGFGGQFGGLPGGGPGGGPGGLPGGGPGEISEDDRATRQAEFAGGDLGSFQDRLLTGAVVRLLQDKTGEAPVRVGPFDTFLTVVAEQIGLTVEEVQTATEEGSTLAEIIEDNGGDIEAVKAALTEALSDSEFFQGQDLEEVIAGFLGESE
jgi:hypothetical protein